MRKAVYRTVSDSQFYKLLVGRIAIIITIVAAMLHIQENPIVISVGVAFLVLIFLISGNESITVYTDSFSYTYGGILKLFSKKVFYYQDLKEVTCEGIFGYGLDKITDSLKISDPNNSIDIVFKNNETEQVRSRIYKDGLTEAVKVINYELKKYQAKK